MRGGYQMTIFILLGWTLLSLLLIIPMSDDDMFRIISMKLKIKDIVFFPLTILLWFMHGTSWMTDVIANSKFTTKLKELLNKDI